MSGEPANFTLEEAARFRARRPAKSRSNERPAGPCPTLGDLQRASSWWWVHCVRCRHCAPMAFAAPVIRWGADAPGDTLRQNARCSCCGNKGATIRHPGWGGNAIGFLPFPSAMKL
jgi:hypothetical protein